MQTYDTSEQSRLTGTTARVLLLTISSSCITGSSLVTQLVLLIVHIIFVAAGSLLNAQMFPHY